MSTTIQADIEQQLAAVEPEVEVLLAEVVGGDTVRLFIDHPDGRHARPLRARHQPPRLACASATRSRSPRPARTAR